jgi:sulfite exporter TauE/SafE
MTPLLVTVFTASLVGSLHCAGMCGGFVALYSASPSCAGAGRGAGARAHLAYNGGRLLTYVLVGLIAGLLGGALDAAASLAGLQRGAAIAAGVVMLAWGGVALARALGAPLGALGGRLPGVGALNASVGRAFAAAARRPAGQQAFLLGFFTPLLPCGWLYLFAVTAAGAGSAWAGAAVMLAFWAGTVPALLGLGLGLRTALGGRLRRHVPALGAVALLVVGGLTLAQRGRNLEAAHTAVLPAEAAAERVEATDPHQLPCCSDDAP